MKGERGNCHLRMTKVAILALKKSRERKIESETEKEKEAIATRDGELWPYWL